MTLEEFLNKHAIPQHTFADRIGVSTRSVSYYLKQERMPRGRTLQRIVEATKGAVTANDFYGAV